MDICERTREMMSLYIDNELGGEQLAQFNKHISECAECAAELSQLTAIVRTLNAMPEEELPDGFHDEFMQKIALLDPAVRKAPREKTFWSSYRPFASAAAGVASTLLVLGTAFNLISSGGGAGMSNSAAPQQTAAVSNGTTVYEANFPENNFSSMDGAQSFSLAAETGGLGESITEQKSMAVFGAGEPAEEAQMDTAVAQMPAAARMDAAADYSPRVFFFQDEAMSTTDAARAAEISSEEYFVKSFSITLEVDDLRQAVAVLDDTGGYNVSSSMNYTGAASGYSYSYITRRVNEWEYEYAKAILRSIGSVHDEYEAERRVTNDILDTQARLAAKEDEAERLFRLLEDSRSLDTMTMLERRLSAVEDEIDSLKTRLGNIAQMPTIEITLLVKAEDVAATVVRNDFGGRARSALVRSFNLTVRAFEGFLVFVSGAFVPILLLSLIIGSALFVRRRIKRRDGNDKE